MIYLIHPDKKQYKANLHAHTIISDGKKTPEELKGELKIVQCISKYWVE